MILFLLHYHIERTLCCTTKSALRVSAAPFGSDGSLQQQTDVFVSPSVRRLQGGWSCRCLMWIWKSYCSPFSHESWKKTTHVVSVSETLSVMVTAEADGKIATCPAVLPPESWDWTAAPMALPGWDDNSQSCAAHWGGCPPWGDRERESSEITRRGSGQGRGGEGYLLWLCFSVWLSMLSRRGKSPERRLTGDFAPHWCQRRKKKAMQTQNITAVLLFLLTSMLRCARPPPLRLVGSSGPPRDMVSMEMLRPRMALWGFIQSRSSDADEPENFDRFHVMHSSWTCVSCFVDDAQVWRSDTFIMSPC